MVSEDSQDFRLLAVIHRLNDAGDLCQPIGPQVPALLHQVKHLDELDEVCSLRRSQRVLLEEGHDSVPQIIDSLHAVPEEVLSVIVVPSVAEHLPAAEVVDEPFEHVTT